MGLQITYRSWLAGQLTKFLSPHSARQVPDYLDEQGFRYNNRKDLNDGDHLDLSLSHIVGKRLTPTELTGIDTLEAHFTSDNTEKNEGPEI